MPKTKKFKELSGRITSDPERRKRMHQQRLEAIGQLIQYQLDELRQSRHITQHELAEALGVHQPNVSRLENADDPKLSTLRAYVEALGGRLELVAVFDDQERIFLAV
jgi:DNA-binding XRE family transcriptional regulator